MDQIEILEAKVKALEELVSIQNETIVALKNKPAQIQIQYVPSYNYWPYQWYPYWQTYGAQSIGGAAGTYGQQYAVQGGAINQQQNQINQQLQGGYAGIRDVDTNTGMGQGCNNQMFAQGSLSLAK